MNVPPWSPAPTPYLYEQVAAHLAWRIRAGELAPGSRLPAEPALAAEYGVAYHTIRGAIRLLREQGLVVSLHGRGTFVAGPEPGGGEPGLMDGLGAAAVLAPAAVPGPRGLGAPPGP